MSRELLPEWRPSETLPPLRPRIRRLKNNPPIRMAISVTSTRTGWRSARNRSHKGPQPTKEHCREEERGGGNLGLGIKTMKLEEREFE
jgi:hypothetical protein